MGRLCERPGCSENASVAYGMRAEDLVFWLDAIRPSEEITGGVLCQRHADSMIVPRNWTLDDLRDPDLHLFRPPPIQRSATSRTRRTGHKDDTVEQLQFGVIPETATDSTIDPERSDGAEPASSAATNAESTGIASATQAARVPLEHDESETVSIEGTASDVLLHDDDPAAPWRPSFDSGDDLDGLLSASSPLLARAFRGDDRPS